MPKVARLLLRATLGKERAWVLVRPSALYVKESLVQYRKHSNKPPGAYVTLGLAEGAN